MDHFLPTTPGADSVLEEDPLDQVTVRKAEEFVVQNPGVVSDNPLLTIINLENAFAEKMKKVSVSLQSK